MSDEALRVLICGSRTYRDAFPIQAVLQRYWTIGPFMVIHGAAKGADSLADFYARKLGVEVKDYPAKWREHADGWCPGDWCRDSGKGYCVAAGPRRNQQMIDEGQPDVVWAFVDKPLSQSTGTKDMVDRARTHGVPWTVVEIGSTEQERKGL